MNTFKFTGLILLTTFLMGSSFAVGKIGLAHSSPLLLVGLRFTLAGIIMVLVVLALKRPHPKTKTSWLKMAVIGAFQTAGVMGCIFLSLRTIPASESSILTFTNPLLVIVFGTLFLKIKYRLYQWVGVFLGIIGVSITLGAQLDFKIGMIFGIFSSIFWAIATLMVNQWGSSFDTWVLTAYQMLFGGLLLLVCSVMLEQPFFVANGQSIFILLWLSIMSSIVQFAVWYYLLQNSNPGKTSAYLFLAPFFGVCTGWLLLEEPLSLSIITGGAFIFMGIFLVNRKFKEKIEPTAKAPHF
ncbi:DMT family transporter [Cytobacillus purgationiresistens]|uniref:Drug/metabolite transporter (DMT)-like permease n=1 Tax=Cytobacillus purgationiresistens TaxID=863449 RepID=A0ABU0AJL2_9BACI|nr:DMT family transporter [Cytobacillus purgationiresistens]MDQ0270603.1 drug/metabolite transporter (DMT)-like permease [Cytobacillus purgationiresistens]